MNWLFGYLMVKNIAVEKKLPRQVLFKGEPGEYFEALLPKNVTLHIYNYATNKVVIIIDNETLWEYSIQHGLLETRSLNPAITNSFWSVLFKRDLAPVTFEQFKDGVRRFVEVKK
jgi:hypothetical protein